MKQGITIRARNIRFTNPAIFRAALAGIIALLFGFCPLPASAQTIGTACATNGDALFGPYNGGIIVCRSLVWTTGLVIDTVAANVLIDTGSTALPSAGSNIAIGRNAMASLGTGASNTSTDS